MRLDGNGNVTHTFKSVGTKANGLAMWRQYLVVLSSEGAAINLVHNTTGAVQQVFKVSLGSSWEAIWTAFEKLKIAAENCCWFLPGCFSSTAFKAVQAVRDMQTESSVGELPLVPLVRRHQPGVDRTWLVQLQGEQVYLKGLAVVED